MIVLEEALNYLELEKKVKDKNKDYNHRVMGIVLAHYSDSLVKNLVHDFYSRWDRVTGYDLDMFWAGYGKYLPECNENDGKVILKFDGNENSVYFDTNQFQDIQKKIYTNLKESYKGNPQIILLECQSGALIYDNYYIIDLEFDKGNDTFNYRMTNRLIHEIAEVCKNSHNLETVIEIFRKDEWKEYVKIVGSVIRFVVKCL